MAQEVGNAFKAALTQGNVTVTLYRPTSDALPRLLVSGHSVAAFLPANTSRNFRILATHWYDDLLINISTVFGAPSLGVTRWNNQIGWVEVPHTFLQDTGEVRIHEDDDACSQCWYRLTVSASGVSAGFTIRTWVEEAIYTLINGIPTASRQLETAESRYFRYQLGTAAVRSPLEWQPKASISIDLQGTGSPNCLPGVPLPADAARLYIDFGNVTHISQPTAESHRASPPRPRSLATSVCRSRRRAAPHQPYRCTATWTTPNSAPCHTTPSHPPSPFAHALFLAIR